MTAIPYRTAPIPSTAMPKGIPYIVGNEAAERFSFYGMKTILMVFMTQFLLTSTGTPAYMTETQAREWVAWFVASAYFFPVIGAIVADALLGKYRTILLLSWLYCAGHLALAMMDLPPKGLEATMEPKSWLMAGLFLIALGSGGIKPCVSAHVGDQFGETNKHLLTRVFGWFYFSINFGSFFSTLLTPWLLDRYGPGWAFGVPGILMAIATIVFWMGRHKFVHIPARGMGFVRETFSGEGLVTIGKLVPIYAFVAIFWALYDQTGGAWIMQAQQMDRNFLGVEWMESQVQAINPLLILIFIPLASYVVFPLIGRVFTLTPIRKIGIGLFLTVAAFSVSATAEERIDAAQSQFRLTVDAAIARGDVDVARTVAALKDERLNAVAAALAAASGMREGVPAEEQPAPDVTAMAKALTEGGIVVSQSGAVERSSRPSIAWQLLAYVIITAAEVLVSITCLEFSYTQAPPQMKSFIMSLYLLSVSAGNVIVALVNRFTRDADGNSTLVGADYYWFFTKMMAVAAVVFIVVGLLYRPRDYMQAEQAAEPHPPGRPPE
jgi:dipeptide/tripeptide permease